MIIVFIYISLHVFTIVSDNHQTTTKTITYKTIQIDNSVNT